MKLDFPLQNKGKHTLLQPVQGELQREGLLPAGPGIQSPMGCLAGFSSSWQSAMQSSGFEI